jgi:hypothetical protein
MGRTLLIPIEQEILLQHVDAVAFLQLMSERRTNALDTVTIEPFAASEIRLGRVFKKTISADFEVHMGRPPWMTSHQFQHLTGWAIVRYPIGRWHRRPNAVLPGEPATSCRDRN